MEKKYENVKTNATAYSTTNTPDTIEFIKKVKELMIEYRVPRIDISIDAFSFLEEHLRSE